MIGIVDAGPLYAIVDADDASHARSTTVLTDPRFRLVLPAMVIPEVAYLLATRHGLSAELALLQNLQNFTIEPPTDADWVRIADLVERYRDFPLGTVDASIIALAERLNVDLIITLDHRHFRAVRPRHVEAFRLLPE